MIKFRNENSPQKMLKRSYIILIAGGVLLIVRASESIDATLQVNDTTRPVSVVLHSGLESINVTLRENLSEVQMAE